MASKAALPYQRIFSTLISMVARITAVEWWVHPIYLRPSSTRNMEPFYSSRRFTLSPFPLALLLVSSWNRKDFSLAPYYLKGYKENMVGNITSCRFCLSPASSCAAPPQVRNKAVPTWEPGSFRQSQANPKQRRNIVSPLMMLLPSQWVAPKTAPFWISIWRAHPRLQQQSPHRCRNHCSCRMIWASPRLPLSDHTRQSLSHEQILASRISQPLLIEPPR